MPAIQAPMASRRTSSTIAIISGVLMEVGTGGDAVRNPPSARGGTRYNAVDCFHAAPHISPCDLSGLNHKDTKQRRASQTEAPGVALGNFVTLWFKPVAA